MTDETAIPASIASESEATAAKPSSTETAASSLAVTAVDDMPAPFADPLVGELVRFCRALHAWHVGQGALGVPEPPAGE